MGLTKKILKNIKGYWNNGILITENILKFQNQLLQLFIVPIILNQNSNKIYYNYNRKN